MGQVVLITVIIFTIVILLLVSLLLYVKAKISPAGKIKITINGEHVLEVDGGGTLLSTLGSNGIFLPSACGGGGTCVQCICQVNSGGGNILPTEEPHFSRKEIADNWRLGCQVKVKEDDHFLLFFELLALSFCLLGLPFFPCNSFAFLSLLCLFHFTNLIEIGSSPFWHHTSELPQLVLLNI